MRTDTITFTDIVQDQLQIVEERMRSNPAAHHENLESAIDHLLSSGGKRIRPTIVLLSGQMLGADENKLISLAAAIEMLHTATLVHDDLIDGAMLRRGIPTLNAQWNQASTVLTGDYIFARAAQLAAQTSSIELIDSFARTLMTIVNGEITQLFDTDTDNLREDYNFRIYAKTGSLIELAAEGGAVLVHAEERIVQAMRYFGQLLGKAFQIIDDVLDFTGNPDLVGKPVANDLRQGLITLPTIHYLEIHPEQKIRVSQLRQGELTPDGQEELITDIRNSEAIKLTIDEARVLIEDAKAILNNMPNTQERHALSEVADYIVDRTT